MNEVKKPPETPDRLLKAMFEAAVGAAQPARVVPPNLPPLPHQGRAVVIGAGKAAAAMARAVEDHWRAPQEGQMEGQIQGLVVTRYGHGVPCRWIEVVEAAHPVPDAAGAAAAARILSLATGLGEGELALCLISGGGSALLSLPAPGLTLEDKRAVNQALLKSGAAIGEMNCVRKHLSAIKGGRLAAAAWPAKLVTLAISDVPGDDPAVIASGPTVADASTFAAARAVLEKYRIDPPPAVARHLRHARHETPKPGAKELSRAQTIVVAAPAMALAAAAAIASEAGLGTVELGDRIEGEARDAARAMAQTVRQAAATAAGPIVLISGGETTVTVRGGGRGGPNTEFLLALAIALDGHEDICAIACDTDGIDGTEDNAGAIIRPDTLARGAALGLNARAYLDDNNGYDYFQALGDLVITGPTQTNVNDFRAILVGKGK